MLLAVQVFDKTAKFKAAIEMLCKVGKIGYCWLGYAYVCKSLNCRQFSFFPTS